MPNTVLLPFPDNCVTGTLLRRVKRFSVECLVDGKSLWAHTNNSGSMLGLTQKGSAVLLSKSENPMRKMPYTLELIKLFENSSSNPFWVGVNTLTPNRLLKAAFFAGRLAWAKGYTRFTPEAKRGNSRLDALLEGKGLPPLWVECKNVTMVEDRVAAFPDAVTERGQKHLHEMMDITKNGERAAFFYCVQRPDAQCFAPADYVDMRYAKLFYDSITAKVEAYPYIIAASEKGIGLGDTLPLAPQQF